MSELINEIPIRLPDLLKQRCSEFKEYLIIAEKILDSFCTSYCWTEYLNEPFAECFEVFDDKDKFDQRLCELCELPDDYELDKTFSAALECNILTAVSPEIYRENYPEGVEEDSYAKLLCHEMAHRLHIRILDGDEDAMGPIWFFEGFAILAANQFKNKINILNRSEIKRILEIEERISYKIYGDVIHTVIRDIKLSDLVKRAGSEDFDSWVLDQLK